MPAAATLAERGTALTSGLVDADAAFALTDSNPAAMAPAAANPVTAVPARLLIFTNIVLAVHPRDVQRCGLDVHLRVLRAIDGEESIITAAPQIGCLDCATETSTASTMATMTASATS
jgi:hypothetical protein